MADMVERVARAIDPQLWSRIDADIADATPFSNAAQVARAKALRTARAAIAAMRDLPMQLETIGDKALDSDCLLECDAGIVWRAIIDAALKEGE